MKSTPMRHQSQSQQLQQRIRGISAGDYNVDMADHQTVVGRGGQRGAGGGGTTNVNVDDVDQLLLSQRGAHERRSYFMAKTPTAGPSNEFEYKFYLNQRSK
jgi:hypothetical protein